MLKNLANVRLTVDIVDDKLIPWPAGTKGVIVHDWGNRHEVFEVETYNEDLDQYFIISGASVKDLEECKSN